MVIIFSLDYLSATPRLIIVDMFSPSENAFEYVIWSGDDKWKLGIFNVCVPGSAKLLIQIANSTLQLFCFLIYFCIVY